MKFFVNKKQLNSLCKCIKMDFFLKTQAGKNRYQNLYRASFPPSNRGFPHEGGEASVIHPDIKIAIFNILSLDLHAKTSYFFIKNR